MTVTPESRESACVRSACSFLLSFARLCTSSSRDSDCLQKGIKNYKTVCEEQQSWEDVNVKSLLKSYIANIN